MQKSIYYNVNICSSTQYKFLKKLVLKKISYFNEFLINTCAFPDGEHNWIVEKPEQLSGKPVVFIAGTINDEAIFELYNLACALVTEHCSSLHVVIPYFGYSTMERQTKVGEVVVAKNIASLLGSIPKAPYGNYIYMIDLHSACTQYYFDNDVHTVHLSARPVIEQMIRLCGNNVVLASVDMGKAKMIEKMGGDLHLDTAYIMKRRLSGDKTEIVALSADVKDRDVVIFDDMIRSGTSLLNAAEAYVKSGAKSIKVITVHGVFANGAVEKLKNSGLIEHIYCTNTHPHAEQIQDDFVTVCDISPIILSGLIFENCLEE